MKDQTNHECCPGEWREVPNITGDYDFDGTIMRRTSPNLVGKLELYTTSRTCYGSTRRLLAGKGL